jgi:hypothetical protein
MPGAPVHAADRRLARRLREQGAVSPGAAEPLDGLWGIQHRRLAVMIRRGLIRETSPGKYYLDEDAWDAYRSRQLRLILILMAILLLVGLVMFALTGKAQASPQAWDVARPDVPKGTGSVVSVDDTHAKRARKVS